ncbi:MAG: fumarylacetoacetate hydrolase family protein [Bacteroidota bacterium]
MKPSKAEIAAQLDDAARMHRPIKQLSLQDQYSLDEAYEIQAISIDRRLGRGEQMTGYKLGFTSQAKMEQMGVHEIIWGRLTDAMALGNGGNMNSKRFIHPRVEPEIAFLVERDIDRELSLANISDYISQMAGALEVIDSRYMDFKFSLEDVVADNCSSSAYVIGAWQALSDEVGDIDLEMVINEDQRVVGNSSAILGSPLNALVEMSKIMARNEITIPSGAVLLAGAATAASYIHAGDEIRASFDRLGSVSLQVA